MALIQIANVNEEREWEIVSERKKEREERDKETGKKSVEFTHNGKSSTGTHNGTLRPQGT